VRESDSLPQCCAHISKDQEQEKMSNFIAKHWRGEYSVPHAVWWSGLAALAMTLPFSYLDLHAFMSINHTSFSDLLARAQSGDLEGLSSLTPSPRIYSMLDQCADFSSFIWWAVGTWRSCANPDHNNNGKDGHWSAKFTIILTAIYEVYGAVDAVKAALGGHD
jgi:hypothetical protein